MSGTPLARTPARALCAALVAVASLIGVSACGSSKAHTSSASDSTTSVSTVANKHTASASGLHASTLKLSTSATLPSGAIDPRYTCHGSNISPPFKWKGVDVSAPNAQELLLFVRWIVHGQISTAWALAGVSPKVTEVKAGQTPEGAIVGKNTSGSVGYSLCPPNVAFVTMGVYAIPRKLHLQTGFDPHKLMSLLESDEVQWGGLTMVSYVPPSTAKH